MGVAVFQFLLASLWCTGAVLNSGVLDKDVAETDDLWGSGFTEYPRQDIGIFGKSIRWNFIFKISS